MIRKMLRTAGIAALAIVMAGVIVEAAATRHRVRHSSRVTVGSAAVGNQTVRKTKRRAGKKRPTVSATSTFKHRTTTKPH